MSLDGSFNPAATYTEAIKPASIHEVVTPYRVQHGGELYAHLSPLKTKTFGLPTADGKFTKVVVNGETVYSEDHPNRYPGT